MFGGTTSVAQQEKEGYQNGNKGAAIGGGACSQLHKKGGSESKGRSDEKKKG